MRQCCAEPTRKRRYEPSRLTKRVTELPAAEYTAAKRYLRLLEGAAEALKLPGAKEYLPGGKSAARGADAAELAGGLIDRKLRFAPAAPGDEPAYAAAAAALERYRNALRVAAP